MTRHAHVSQFESKNGYRHNFSNSKIRGRDAVGVTLRYPILPANPANGRKSASKFSYFRGRDTPFYTLLVNIVVPRPRTNPTRLISKLYRHHYTVLAGYVVSWVYCVSEQLLNDHLTNQEEPNCVIIFMRCGRCFPLEQPTKHNEMLRYCPC